MRSKKVSTHSLLIRSRDEEAASCTKQDHFQFKANPPLLRRGYQRTFGIRDAIYILAFNSIRYNAVHDPDGCISLPAREESLPRRSSAHSSRASFICLQSRIWISDFIDAFENFKSFSKNHIFCHFHLWDSPISAPQNILWVSKFLHYIRNRFGYLKSVSDSKGGVNSSKFWR